MLLDLKHGALLFFVAEWLFGIFLPTWTYIYASCCKRFSTFRSLLNHERRIVWVSLRSFFEDLDACTDWTAETKVGSNFQIRLFLLKTIFDRSSFTSDSPIQYADACYAPITKCQHIHNLSKSSETSLAVGIKTCNSSVHEPWQYPKERGCLTVAFKCLFILNTQPGVSSSYVSVTEAAQQATNTLYQCSNGDVNGSSYLEVQPHYATQICLRICSWIICVFIDDENQDRRVHSVHIEADTALEDAEIRALEESLSGICDVTADNTYLYLGWGSGFTRRTWWKSVQGNEGRNGGRH